MSKKCFSRSFDKSKSIQNQQGRFLSQELKTRGNCEKRLMQQANLRVYMLMLLESFALYNFRSSLLILQ